MSAATGLIQGGDFALRADFPWTVSIEKKGKRDFSGTLISSKHVITHPDAVTEYDYDLEKYERVRLNSIKIFLGATQNTDFKIEAETSRIVIHPNYQTVDGTDINAIAMLTLRKSVNFNDFIRPACVWNLQNDDIKSQIKNPFYVVGFGIDENGVSNVKKHLRVNLINDADCKKKHFREENVFKSTNAFCISANEQDAAPCDYDYHLFVKNNNKWYLRGTLISFQRSSFGGCVASYYPMYEDMAKYKSWIQAQIE